MFDTNSFQDEVSAPEDDYDEGDEDEEDEDDDSDSDSDSESDKVNAQINEELVELVTHISQLNSFLFLLIKLSLLLY
jgi:hypothetical protein